MEWSRSTTTEFIELYQSKPCLWKISSVEYKNKNLKTVAYNELIDFLKTKGLASATLKEVKSKIQNIRRMVRKERVKVEASRRSGRGTDDLYTPTLWYYDLLSFANDMDPHESIDNLGGTCSNYNTNLDEENYDSNSLELTENDSQYSEQDIESDTSNTKYGQNHVFQIPSSPLQGKKTKKQKMDDNVSNFMKKCSEALEKTNVNKLDEYEAMGINFAAKLKKMKPEQQIHAELLFQKICAKGLLGQLNENFDIVDIGNNYQIPKLKASLQEPDSSTY